LCLKIEICENEDKALVRSGFEEEVHGQRSRSMFQSKTFTAKDSADKVTHRHG
jgi:hypothetical protein